MAGSKKSKKPTKKLGGTRSGATRGTGVMQDRKQIGASPTGSGATRGANLPMKPAKRKK